MNEKKYYVYFTTNKGHNVLYVGVTGNITRRTEEHKSGTSNGFTQRYNAKQLLYYEVYNDIETAIAREKQIKSWSRQRKNDLINEHNPNWEEVEI